MYVLLGWKVFNDGTPILKFLKMICGTYCLYPAGAAGIMPRPLALLKPRSERFAKLPVGESLWVAVRKKIKRASFTAVGPIFLVLLMTNSCARVGVDEGKPGTLAFGSARAALESSKW